MSRRGKFRFIYIAGMAHSGSTATDFLLGRLVGRSCGQVAELGRYVDSAGLPDEPRIADSHLGEWADYLRQASVEDRLNYRWLYDDVVHERHILAYLFSAARRREYAGRFDRSIAPIFARCSTSTVIDSSKNASRAMAIASSELCDVFVVHLMRSPLDYLASKVKRSGGSFGILLQIKELLRWSAKNVLVGLLRLFHPGRYFLMRYDVLYTDPYNTMAPLFSALDLHVSKAEFETLLGEMLVPPETIGGNNIRVSGPLKLELKTVSEEQVEAISPFARRLCDLLERAMMPKRELAPA